jgi:hypothetical protein
MTGLTHRLRAIAARVFDSWTIERIIDPLLGDIDREHTDAVLKGYLWRGRWIIITGHLLFVKMIAICGAMGLIRSLRELSLEDRLILNRTLRVSAIAITVAAALFELPGLYRWPYAWQQTHDLALLIYSVPQALVVAIPIGLTLGILLGMRGRGVSSRSSVALMVWAAGCSLACFVALAWVVPMSNYEFRKIVFSRDGASVGKDMNDLTLGELSQRLEPYRPGTALRPEAVSESVVSYSFHMRMAFSCATFVLALLALSLSRKIVTRRMASLAFFGLCVSYYGMMWGGRAAALDDTLPAFFGAWLPNVVIGLLAIVWLSIVGRSSRNAGNDAGRHVMLPFDNRA